MSKTYLELASTFRNRLEYPNPANFITKPCEPNLSDRQDIQNNISDAYPFYNFWSLPMSIVRSGKTSPGIDIKPAELQLISMNYGLDTCDLHPDTQGPDALSLTKCCVGTSSKPVFSNVIKPMFTLANAYEPTASPLSTNVESSSCLSISSIYNVYSTTGLIKSTSKKCCINQYFTGMTLTNFKTNQNSECNECSGISMSSETSTLPSSRCCDISLNHQDKIYTITADASGALLNNNGCSVSCPVTDSIVFQTNNEFSSTFECFDWYSLSPVLQEISISVPNANSKIKEPSNFNWVNGIQISQPSSGASGVVIDGLTGTLPAPGILSFTVQLDASSPQFQGGTPLFTATSLIVNNVQVVTEPHGGLITINTSSPSVSYLQNNIDCPKAQYNPYVVNDSAWNCIRIHGGGPQDANNSYCCSIMEFIPAPIDAYKYFSQALPNGLSDRFKSINSYNANTKLASFNAYDCCDANVQKQWQRMIYWMLWARCGRNDNFISYNPDSPCSQTQLNNLAGGTTDIDACQLTWYDNGVEKTTTYPEYSLPTQGTNYIWNYRMRKQIPAMIATSNPGTLSITLENPSNPVVSSSSSGIDYLETTPPMFIYGVPYNVELLNGGSGYSRGGYFIYGNENCDLFEIRYTVSAGSVVDVQLTRLSIDRNIYKNMGAQINTSSGTTNVLKCDTSSRELYFNNMIPDVIEMNQIVLPKNSTNEYTYTWDGYNTSTRKQNTWFGGSGACIRISKGYGFFSNLGRTEKTNYALKNSNSRTGPSNNNYAGCLLSIPSCAESCISNFGERRNSLNFSTVYQTNNQYTANCDTIPPTTTPTQLSGKWQYDSEMKFYQQYPKSLNKEVDCNYKYSTPSFDATTTGTTPIIANFHTQDISIYWTYSPNATPSWQECRFNDLNTNTFNWVNSDTAAQQLINASVMITRNSFPGYPLNIDGLWNIPAHNSSISGTNDISWVFHNQTTQLSSSQLQQIVYETQQSGTHDALTSRNLVPNTPAVQQISSNTIIQHKSSIDKLIWSPFPLINEEQVSLVLTHWIDPTISDNSQILTFVRSNLVALIDNELSRNPSNVYISYGENTALISNSTLKPIGNNVVKYKSSSVSIYQNWPDDVDAVEQSVDFSSIKWFDSQGFSHELFVIQSSQLTELSTTLNQESTKTLPTQCCAYEWEILPVTADAINPINNQMIPKSSTQEASCWRVQLRNIVLPNITLQSGSVASFYPYFYVELSNVSENNKTKGMIQSNNPNAKNALFRCAVTDIANPTITKFIKLSGDGMQQTVKFRPQDSLQIKVYLPDGREFMTSLSDTAPPSRPNQHLQITALFEIEKVN